MKARSLVYDRLLFLGFCHRATLFARTHIYVCVTSRFAELFTATPTGDVKGWTPCGRCRRLLKHWHRGLTQRALSARNLYGLRICHDVVLVNPREEIGKVLGWALFSLPPQNVSGVRMYHPFVRQASMLTESEKCATARRGTITHGSGRF